MSRTTMAIVGGVVLALGIAGGVGLGSLLGPGASGPVAVVGTPAPSPSTPGPVVTPGTAPSGTPSPAPVPTPAPTPLPTPSPEPTPTPEPTPVLVAAPLTGEPVTEKVAARHVVAVMIDDLSAARPQSGLSQADVVWHAPAEGGIPRYMALFGSRDPKSVGPIRSTRLYYVAWAAEWRSVLAHAGGSPQAIAYLASAKGRRAVYDSGWSRFFYRVPSRYAPHNLYSDGKSLRQLAKAVGAKAVAGQAPVWSFAPDAPLGQRPEGGRIVVPYKANVITYAYDRKSNTYRRSVSVEGKQFDAGLKPRVRVAPKNVVVMRVLFVPTGDSKGRLDGQVTGTGTAWISTNGRTVKGTWAKDGFTAPTRFFGPDGKEVVLTIGQTFIQVVPRSTKITIERGKVPTASPSPSAPPSSTP